MSRDSRQREAKEEEKQQTGNSWPSSRVPRRKRSPILPRKSAPLVASASSINTSGGGSRVFPKRPESKGGFYCYIEPRPDTCSEDIFVKRLPTGPRNGTRQHPPGGPMFSRCA